MSAQYMELGSFPKPRCIYFANSLSSLIKTSKPQTALFVRLNILLLLVVLYKLSFPVAKFYHLQFISNVLIFLVTATNQYICRNNCRQETLKPKKEEFHKISGVLHVITLTAVNYKDAKNLRQVHVKVQAHF